MLFVRTLYECLPNDIVILPANQKRIRVSAAGAIQSLWHEVSRPVSASDIALKNKTSEESPNCTSKLSCLIETDLEVIKMLEQLF